MRRVGIMGGTFDPIHNGHLVAAEEARVRFSLDKVIFVPSGHPPHKEGHVITSAHDRYMMCVLATLSNPFFEVSPEEMDRPGPSYAIDTVRAFLDRLPSRTRLYFITGADAILEIFSWKDAESLLSICHFAAATRPGYILPVESSRDIFRGFSHKVHFFEVPALAISSTDIRSRVRQGRPTRYLLPDTVMDYMNKSGLYRNELTTSREE